MRLGIFEHMMFQKILSFLVRPRLVRDFSVRRIDDDALAARNAKLFFRVILYVICWGECLCVPNPLQVRLAVSQASHGTALFLLPLPAPSLRERAGDGKNDDRQTRAQPG